MAHAIELSAIAENRPHGAGVLGRVAPLALAIGLYAAICAVLLWRVLAANDGLFIYTLDDPYIHLALARTLWTDGVYGISAHEASAPSSSIIWPFLLAPFAATRVFEYAPLAINVALSVAILAVVARGAQELAPGARLARLAPLAAIVLLNLPGLTFNGMEHLLHVLVTLLAVLGVIRAARGEAAGTLAIIAAIAAPLVRYEGAAVTLAACVAYVLVGAWRRAAVIAVASGALLAAFSLFLMSLGLGPLPSSVLVKAELDRGALMTLLGNIALNIDYGPFYTIAIAAVFAAAIAVHRWRSDRAIAVLALAALIVAGLHIVFGRFGWLSRYEVYVAAAILPLMVAVLRAQRPHWRASLVAQGKPTYYLALACGLAVAPMMARYAWDGIVRTSTASHSIYAQQHQMARFAAQNRIPAVAVNDLGWVAYASGARALDLWGLGSEQARRARLSRDPRWMDGLMARHPDVTLAMIYQNWLPGPYPDSWVKLGDLVYALPNSPIAPAIGDARVSFFATSPTHAPALRSALAQFAATLPRSAVIELAPAR